MYILKNAWKSICRSKGRNALIGLIVLVIGMSSCVALSIREASTSAKKTYLENMEITAQISMDRQSMMKGFRGESGEFDRESMKEMLTNQEELTLEEMLTYAKAKSVKDFYYSGTTSVDTDDNWDVIDTTGIKEDTETNSKETSKNFPNMGGQRPDMPGFGKMGVQGDCTIAGYSSDEAMIEFLKGTSSITDGEMFEEGTEEYDCVISDELATYNELQVGDKISVVNPNKEGESYELSIVGIYHNEQSGQAQSGMMGGFSASSDVANRIYMSYEALDAMIQASEANADVETDENTGRETSTALKNQISGTYTFATVEDYEAFEEEVRELGLSDSYTISSSDLNSYEESLGPLNNLSEYAMYFFIVILIIGGIILAVLNIFNIRERKYEVGVLAAIGMKKWKIAVQFTLELLCVTFVSIIIGTAIGAVGSVPITNALLEKQITSQTEVAEEQMQNFGRGEKPGGNIESGNQSKSPADVPNMNDGGRGGFFNKMGSTMVNYVDEVESATNLKVIVQLIGVGVLLTLISSLFAVLFVLRYDPLKIMANRD